MSLIVGKIFEDIAWDLIVYQIESDLTFNFPKIYSLKMK